MTALSAEQTFVQTAAKVRFPPNQDVRQEYKLGYIVLKAAIRHAPQLPTTAR